MIFDATTIISSRTGANPVPAIPTTALIVRGNTILINGEIDFGTYDAIEAILEKPSEPITTVRLDSNGGRIYAARGIARILIWHRLDTEVDKRCISACTLVFLAGNRRKLWEGAQLGFHQYAQASDVPLLDTAEEQEKDRLFLKARGVSDSFLRKMFQAEHNDIWFPDGSVASLVEIRGRRNLRVHRSHPTGGWNRQGDHAMTKNTATSTSALLANEAG